ncbi:MAG: hypothetical protein AB7R55_12850 [Gemmatimonadales bacterium]
MILYVTQSRGGTTASRLEDEVDRLLINPGRVAESVPKAFAGYVGRYVANFGRFENEVFEAKVKDGKLVLDILSVLPFVLVWLEAEQRWAAEIVRDQLQISFDPSEGGPARKLVFHQFGAAFDVPRFGSPAADALARDREVSEAELSDAVGRYGGPDFGHRHRGLRAGRQPRDPGSEWRGGSAASVPRGRSLAPARSARDRHRLRPGCRRAGGLVHSPDGHEHPGTEEAHRWRLGRFAATLKGP